MDVYLYEKSQTEKYLAASFSRALFLLVCPSRLKEGKNKLFIKITAFPL